MRKILLSFILAGGLFAGANAQCTPDPQYTQSGLYPDSATGLPTAYVGYPYNEVITIVVPQDTAYDAGAPFGTVIVTIDYIEVTGVTGLPPNFTYQCNPTNCQYPGGSTGCAVLYSTVDPVAADIGMYNLTINTWNQLAPPYDSFSQAGSYNYYYIEVKDSTGVNVGIKTYTDVTFSLADMYPNPVQNEARIQFLIGEPSPVSFTITNLLGEVVETRMIQASQGVNTFYVNTDKMNSGIYLYSVESNGRKLTKRMIVSK